MHGRSGSNAFNPRAEIWRAAHGIGTAPAYQAYPDSFPQGAFAPLAQAGLGREIESDDLRAGAAAPAVATLRLPD